MAFTIEGLAQELGIDPSTLSSKGDVVAKYNGYLSTADSQYREARETLDRASREQQAIDEVIRNAGLTETQVAELRAENASYKAALQEVKSQGLNVNLPEFRAKEAPAADPLKSVEQLMKSNFANMGSIFRVQSKYQSVYNKPFADDPTELIDEAQKARLPLEQYAEQKYKFGEEQEKQRQAEVQRKIDEGVQAGLKAYQEKNPVTYGNPNHASKLASRHPQVVKPRNREEQKDFRKMPIRDRIASSVARAREAYAASAE